MLCRFIQSLGGIIMAVRHTFYLTKVDTYGEPLTSTVTFQATTAEEWRKKALNIIKKDLKATNPNYVCGKEERDEGLKGVYYFTPKNKDKKLKEEMAKVKKNIASLEKKIERQNKKEIPNQVKIAELKSQLSVAYDRLEDLEDMYTVSFFYILENVEFCVQNGIEMVGKVA